MCPKQCRSAVTPWANFRGSRSNGASIDGEGACTWRRSAGAQRQIAGKGTEKSPNGFTDRSLADGKSFGRVGGNQLRQDQILGLRGLNAPLWSWRSPRMTNANDIRRRPNPSAARPDVPPRTRASHVAGRRTCSGCSWNARYRKGKFPRGRTDCPGGRRRIGAWYSRMECADGRMSRERRQFRLNPMRKSRTWRWNARSSLKNGVARPRNSFLTPRELDDTSTDRCSENEGYFRP